MKRLIPYLFILVTAAGAQTSGGGGTGGGGGGSVTTFTAGNLPPLFTTGVANPTTAPALSFTASTVAQNSVLAGPVSGGTGAYSFRALQIADLPAITFDQIGSGTNLGHGLVCGNGCVIAPAGTGFVSANEFNGVPFCTGFTPTTGQNLQYSTGLSPNPCYTAAAAAVPFSPYPSTLTPPLASSLTFVNQRTYTATDKTGRLVVVGNSANTVQGTFLFSSTALPSPPYTVQMCGMMTGAANSAISMGVAVLDNSNNAVTSSLYSSPSVSAFTFNVRWYFTASGTTSSGFGNTLIDTYGSSFTCERITDTGTTRTFYHSANGKSYYFVSSEASNTNVTPTKFGLFVYGNDSNVSTTPFVFDIYDLEVANSILPQFAN